MTPNELIDSVIVLRLMETDGTCNERMKRVSIRPSRLVARATDLENTGPNGIPHKQGWTVKNMLNHHLGKLYPLVNQYSWVEIPLSH